MIYNIIAFVIILYLLIGCLTTLQARGLASCEWGLTISLIMILVGPIAFVYGFIREWYAHRKDGKPWLD